MLSLFLLHHALAPGVSDAHARSRLPSSPTPSNPYLKVATLVPLRFNSPPPPPDLTSKPAAGAPPQPLEAAPANVAAPVASVLPPPVESKSTVQPTPTTASNTLIPFSGAPVSAEPVAPPPSSILPDDTRTVTKAEDFLPFFQFPNAGGDVTVVVPATAPRAPAPGTLPPSSATYQQK